MLRMIRSWLLIQPCVTWAERFRNRLFTLQPCLMALIVLGFTSQRVTTRPSGRYARIRCRSTSRPSYSIFHRHRVGRLEYK